MNNFLEKIKPIFSKIKQALSPITAFFKKHSEMLNPILVLTAICIVIAAALSLTNSLTADKIAKINAENKVKEMRVLLPADDYVEQTVKGFETDEKCAFYSAVKNNITEGYIVTSTAKGYGGDIVVMTAFNAKGEIEGISIISAEDETPGLGQNINKDAFRSQFKATGKAGQLTVVKNSADNAAGEIDAVTGATTSSKGVVKAVNQSKAALAAFLASQNIEPPVPPVSNTDTVEKDDSTTNNTQQTEENSESTQGGNVIENQ